MFAMRRNLFILAVLVMAVGTVFVAYRYNKATTNIAKNEKGLSLVTTVFPLAEFASQVTKSTMTRVSFLVPAGIEPHDYEPTPRDIATLYAANIVVINGGGMDIWAEKIRPQLEKKGIKVIVMSQELGLEQATDISQSDDAESVDPHFWLDPTMAAREVTILKNVLKQIDTLNAMTYEKNATAYQTQLASLDNDYRSGTATCSQHTVITSHNAFHYVAQRYGFEALSIAGMSPENEPSTRQLAQLSTLAKEKNIRFVFFETLTSPRLSQTLADEIGARTLVFNPFEGLTTDEIRQGKNYLSVMRENLLHLQIALECYEE